MSEEIMARVGAFLSDTLGTTVTVDSYEPITGGYSRAMSRFWADVGGERRGFVMRADPPPGQSILDTDRSDEWDVLNALAADGSVSIAEPLHCDLTGDKLGSPTFISEMVQGDTLHVLANDESTDNASYTERLAQLAASVHAFDVSKLPEAIERPGSWDDYITASIQRWRDYEAEHCESEPFMRTIAAWLDAHRPPPAPLTLVHGDYQGPNILVEHDTGEFHFLDWELAHVGDPREDLGWWTLAMGSQPPDLIADDQANFYETYRAATGLSEDVVNPQTVAYFTVFSSFLVFSNIAKTTSRLARGENMGSSVAYMTNAMPYMHSAWIASMGAAGHWNPNNEPSNEEAS